VAEEEAGNVVSGIVVRSSVCDAIRSPDSLTLNISEGVG